MKNVQVQNANWHPFLENQLSYELLVNCSLESHIHSQNLLLFVYLSN